MYSKLNLHYVFTKLYFPYWFEHIWQPRSVNCLVDKKKEKSCDFSGKLWEEIKQGWVIKSEGTPYIRDSIFQEDAKQSLSQAIWHTGTQCHSGSSCDDEKSWLLLPCWFVQPLLLVVCVIMLHGQQLDSQQFYALALWRDHSSFVSFTRSIHGKWQ